MLVDVAGLDVDDGAGLDVVLLGEPEALEGRERAEVRAARPREVLAPVLRLHTHVLRQMAAEENDVYRLIANTVTRLRRLRLLTIAIGAYSPTEVTILPLFRL